MKYRGRTRPALRKLQSQINITPLIDVLLVLIVIFMVITPVTPVGLPAEVPREPVPETPQTAPPPETLVLNLDADGALSLNRQPIHSNAELTERLQSIFKTRTDHTLFVQGDASLSFEIVMHVIDAARGGGADRIGLMTSLMR